MNPVLKELLLLIRQHDGYRLLLEGVDKPTIRPFVKSRAANVEQARSEWIFESGQMANHEAWLGFLSGTIPHNGEVNEET